jgi:hypothetical protein
VKPRRPYSRRGLREARGGTTPAVSDVRGYFASLWASEAGLRPVRFGNRETKESFLNLGTRMLTVLCAAHDPTTTVGGSFLDELPWYGAQAG